MTVVQQLASPIKVGMVLDQPFPANSRVEREAVALIQAGYQVHLLCLNSAQTQDLDSVYRGMYIHRVNPKDVTAQMMGMKHRLPYQGLAKAWKWHQYHIDSVWVDLISRFVDRLALDVLHIVNLKLMHTALAVADKRGIPVIGDLPDNTPARQALQKGNGDKKAMATKGQWDHIEKLACWQADRLLVNTKEAQDRLVAKGIAASKIAIIPDAVDADRLAHTQLDPDIQRMYKHTFLLTYVGNAHASYQGLETVLQAIHLLKWDMPELKFVIAGSVSPAYETVLKKQIAAMELERFVDVTNTSDDTSTSSFVAASDVCLHPYLANDYSNTTFPSQLFLYHWYGRPIIASNSLPVERYLTETQGGLVYDSGNAEQLATAIWQLYRNSALRRQMAEQGRQSVIKQHNWQVQAPAFIQVYDDVMQVERTDLYDVEKATKPFAPDIGYLLHSEIYPV
jgi:glycosyltransferase involved in cell wall biosynthesis